jgi:ADP-ribosyl-[dinitrogen reductase] hydrolase
VRRRSNPNLRSAAGDPSQNQKKTAGRHQCDVALVILLARSSLPRAALRRRLVEDFGYDLAPQRALARDGFDISAAGTAPPAITAALEAEDWEGVVRPAVCLGGDTDTLVLYSRAVAEAIHGLRREIAYAARAHRYVTRPRQKF